MGRSGALSGRGFGALGASVLVESLATSLGLGVEPAPAAPIVMRPREVDTVTPASSASSHVAVAPRGATRGQVGAACLAGAALGGAGLFVARKSVSRPVLAGAVVGLALLAGVGVSRLVRPSSPLRRLSLEREVLSPTLITALSASLQTYDPSIVSTAPVAVRPPPVTPSNASLDDLRALFAQASQRTEDERKAAYDKTKADLDAEMETWGSYLPLPYAGMVLRYAGDAMLYLTNAIANLFQKNDWNSDENVARVKAELVACAAWGIAPIVFNDDLYAGAKGYADGLHGDAAAFEAQPGDFRSRWSDFRVWLDKNPFHGVLLDALNLGWWPISLFDAHPRSSLNLPNQRGRAGIAALGHLVAAWRGKGRDVGDLAAAAACSTRATLDAAKLGDGDSWALASAEALRLEFDAADAAARGAR